MHGNGGETLEVSRPPETVQLKQAFLEQLGTSMATARLKSGLLARDAANQAGLSEELIRQFETTAPGNLTIEQLVDIALVYNWMPLDLAFAEREEIQEFAEQMPGRPRTVTNFEAWRARRSVQRALALADESGRHEATREDATVHEGIKAQ